MAARMMKGPPIMNAITIHVFAISPILPSPPERWVLSTNPHSANSAPPPVKIHPSVPRTAGWPPTLLGQPAEDDAPVVGVEDVQEVGDRGPVGEHGCHLAGPPASAVVQSLIPE